MKYRKYLVEGFNVCLLYLVVVIGYSGGKNDNLVFFEKFGDLKFLFVIYDEKLFYCFKFYIYYV